jgi:membrane associated rhomboid family serine protease
MRYQKEKIFNLPPAVLWMLALLVGIEAFCEIVPPESYLRILRTFAFVPGRFTYAFDPQRAALAFGAIANGEDLSAEAASFFLGNGRPLWWTPVTYAFLHGGWIHLGINSVWFAAFGSPVARRFGTPRFLLLCAFAAAAGAIAHYISHPTDLEPVIGASAAVSGVMAAAARFVFQPGALVGEPGFARGQGHAGVYRGPAIPMREIFFNRSAISFLAFWFLANLLFAAVPAPAGVTNAAVAWQAHIGGFVFGLFAFRWFDPPSLASRGGGRASRAGW